MPTGRYVVQWVSGMRNVIGATISRQLPASGGGELCVGGSGVFPVADVRSVVVPVAVVQGVPVAVVDVVDVVAVQDALVAAVLAVLVGVLLMDYVVAGLALVPVAAVLAVQVAVVGVVDVVLVRNRGVAAVRAVRVGVGGVLQVEGGHGAHLRKCGL
jgi:hypothetical protein